MLSRLKGDERGSVLVIVAVGVPTFILIAALALDFGNWYAHKRSLQNRVDAAAFAASVAYGYNFPTCTQNTPAGTNAANSIATAALQYAGKGATPYNGTNSDGTTVTLNPDGPNPCQPHPTGDYSSPSGAMWADVHANTTVSSLFGGFGFVPTITANARVAVMQLQSATSFRPLAVANPAYTTGECVWAVFDNTQGGSTTVPLTLQSNGHWRATSAPVRLTSQDSPVSVRLGDDCANSNASITYDNMGYVGAYDQGSAGSEPKLQDLFVTPQAPCDGLYVSRYTTAGCDFVVSAEINWGNRFPVGVSANGVTLTGAFGSWQGTLHFLAGAGEPGNGTVPIVLTGRYRNLDVNGDPVGRPIPFNFGTGSNGQVQSIMAGNDQHEGLIRDFTLSQVSAHDNQMISETIDLTFDSLTSTATTFVLRARAGGGSGGDNMLNGVVDCADGQSFSQRIAYGCKSSYQVHAQSLCSGAPPTPPDCIQGSGTPSSVVTSAYNPLWAPGGNCSNTPNRWSSYPNIPRGDPRLITIPVTRIEAPFSSSANHPVVSFAAFYVTGWRGMPSGCGDPAPLATANFGSADNAIWGHFIRFVEPSGTGAPKNSGTPANDLCDPNSTDIAACIATLVQ